MSIDPSDPLSIASSVSHRAPASSTPPPLPSPRTLAEPPIAPGEPPASNDPDSEGRVFLRIIDFESLLSSAIFHLVLLVGLGLIAERIHETTRPGHGDSETSGWDGGTIDATTEPSVAEPDLVAESLDRLAPELTTPDALRPTDAPLASTLDPVPGVLMEAPSGLGALVGAPPGLGATAAPVGTGPPGDLNEDLARGATGIGGSLQGRMSAEGRAVALRSGGGTPESERAVDLALAWLAEHQLSDGSWNFNHAVAPHCHRRCANPGVSSEARAAATGLALLPFLGAGQTHQQGKYSKNVEAGLRYLVRHMTVQNNMGSLWEPVGNMYGHGLASIALCEAYGMTKDSWLRQPAQLAVNFIVEAQDVDGGGWRYHARDIGDTSVVGWQLMALKSAHLAQLDVPQITIHKASYFLDAVQFDEGSTYGYLSPGTGPATSAIGLLCRMYIGWKREHPALIRGVESISRMGPSMNNPSHGAGMYYNYYATQVMHHYGGKAWESWNQVMRDWLISTQARRGHERGSWFFPGDDMGAMAGGRLYDTALSAMVLEVYYRHMPLYSEHGAGEAFFH